MRVDSVNCHNYLQKPMVKSKQNKILKQELNMCENEINFKGKKWAILQSIAWAGLGFVVAGPAGAIVGAGVGAGVGSSIDDDEPSSGDSNKPYNP